MNKHNRDYCIHCGKETEYRIIQVQRSKTVKGKEYLYETAAAVCSQCGGEMSIPGSLDRENQDFDTAYRKAEEIVSIANIQNVMEMYDIGKAPLSIALGFGEITITRYLLGQMPSKEYSDIIRQASIDPDFMLKNLEENQKKLGPTAYKKSKDAVMVLKENLNGISKKMISVISYMFKNSNEITPLALQKLLYFAQGMNMAVNKKALFKENCEAWIHGPVYRNVYQLFKEFSYNAIDDSKFVIFDLAQDELNQEEKKIVDMVMATFGLYSGKVLEQITHAEDPWKNARKGFNSFDASNQIISKESINAYFQMVDQKYNLGQVKGIKQYIRSYEKYIGNQ